MKDDIVSRSAARTPVGAFNGAFANLPAHELGKVAPNHGGSLRALWRRGTGVSEVIMCRSSPPALGRTARQASSQRASV